jgi:pSer/pThr/pTyr-binding forkhead associated (FHA) protein
MAASRRSSKSPATGTSAGRDNSTRARPSYSTDGGGDEEWASPETGEEQRPEDYGDAEDHPWEEDPFDGSDSLPPLDEEEEAENPEATRAGPPLTLEIIEGPDRGRRRRFKSVRMVIGRGQGCDVVLSDQSVSRRHVELVYGEGGTLLRDLGSGNGTKVNDERVDERQMVHDDVIAIGRTKLRFVDEQERAKRRRAEAEEAERKAKEDEERKARGEEEAVAAGAAAGAMEGAEEGQGEPQAEGAEGGEPQQEEEGAAPPEGQEAQEGDAQGTQASQAQAPARKPERKRQLFLLIGGVAVLLLLVGSGVAVWWLRRTPPVPAVEPRVERAMKLMEEARSAFKRGDYAEAVRLAEEAVASAPSVDSQSFLDMARKELAIVQAFQQVRRLMDENLFDEARTLLAQTPTSKQTEEARARLESDLNSRETLFMEERVEALLAARDVEGARALISRLPMERQPLYLGRLDEVEARIAADKLEAEMQAQAQNYQSKKRAKEQREAFIQNAFRVVEMRFHAGDYERAAGECDRVFEAHRNDKEIRERARRVKQLIPQFARVYKDAQHKVQSNALESAARPLSSSANLYRQMGFKGPLLDSINSQLAVCAVVAGKGALSRNDLDAAMGFLQEALRLRPDDVRAQEAMAALEDRLETLYKQAYVQRDRDRDGAIEKLRTLLRLSPQGSELNQKGEELLQTLQQP